MSDYTAFQQARQPAWKRLATLLDQADRDLKSFDYQTLEDLARLHREVLGDYAWARSHFPGTEVDKQLRALCFRGHRRLAARLEPLSRRIWRFYVQDYPQVFRNALPDTQIAGLLFLMATLLGSVITTTNPEFSAMFIGTEQLAGLRDGVIWTDELDGVASSFLSSSIWTNNVGVAITTWAGGALFGLLTLFVLLHNGLMFGSILSICAQTGMTDRLFAFISAHGPLELFLIVVASGAGLHMAASQLRHHGRRLEAFAEAARRSALLMVGTAPWLIGLGFVEGYISPISTLPTSWKLALGVMLVVLFGAYVNRPPQPGLRA